MSLKLFRSTGYSSILTAGEARMGMHPRWMIIATSIWVGFPSNAALWRQWRTPGHSSLALALAFGAFVAAACAIVLGVLGWRKTLKPAALMILFVAALGVCALLGQPSPQDFGAELPSLQLVLPTLTWQGLLQWQHWVTFGALAVVPAVGISRTRVRRLPGHEQFSCNLACIFAAAVVLASSGFVLFGSFFR